MNKSLSKNNLDIRNYGGEDAINTDDLDYRE